MIEAGRRGLVWTPRTLDAFLADPLGVVPHSDMAEPGLADAAERQAVIEYLEAAGRRPAGGPGVPAK